MQPTPSPNEWTFNRTNSCFYLADGTKLDFQFNPKERVFTTSLGVDLMLSVVTSDLVLTFQTQLEYLVPEPEAPKKPQEYGDNEFYMKADYSDSEFIQRRGLAIRNRGLKLMHFMYGVSIDNDLDELEREVKAVSDKYARMSKSITPKGDGERAYLLATSCISSEIEITALTSIIQGQVLPTAEAILTAENRFPDQDQ